jgi:hypothetical protein
MTGTPTWQAATTGQAPLAAHVNQYLGTHTMQVLYTGTQRAAQSTAGSGTVTTNGTYLAQSFTTALGQTAIGYVVIQLAANTSTGANLAPTTVSIQANSSGAPSGTALVSATVTAEYVFNGPTLIVVPTPVGGLTASTTYWIVVAAAGNATYSYNWAKSNQTSGASTSANGTSWTAQTYGFIFQVYDQAVTGQQTATWEDAGARWTWTGRSATGLVNAYAAYTAGQTPAGYLQSYRAFTTSNGLLTAVR